MHTGPQKSTKKRFLANTICIAITFSYALYMAKNTYPRFLSINKNEEIEIIKQVQRPKSKLDIVAAPDSYDKISIQQVRIYFISSDLFGHCVQDRVFNVKIRTVFPFSDTTIFTIRIIIQSDKR